jgi:hypothetical protein
MAIELGMMAISIGMSLLANQLFKPKSKSPIQDDKPTTLTTRGSYIPWFQGTRRVGPVVCFADNRTTSKEKIGGGGGKSLFSSSSPKQVIYHEEGVHVVGVGPMKKLHRIYANGKIIFDGPITIESHPNGTEIDLGKEGAFRVWWGEKNPTATLNYLSDASRLEINSKWPYICMVIWTRKRLGSSPQWPLMEYVFEKRPTNTVLSNSNAYMAPDQIEGSTTYGVYGNNDGAPEVGYFKLYGDFTPNFKPGNAVKWNKDAGGSEDLSGTTIDDTLNPYELSAGFGINPAHVIAELLFADYPNGLGLDQGNWDIEALEEVGVLASAANEDLYTNWLGQNGEEVRTILGGGMQDLGLLIPFDPETGLLTFKTIREPTISEGADKTLQASHIVRPLPEIETLHFKKQSDKLVFSFSDQAYNYRDNTISIDDDGTANYLNYQTAKDVPITIATNFEIASKIAERRSQEELAGATVFKIYANREARMIVPGDSLIVPGFSEILRVSEVKVDPLMSKVTITCSVDFYGARLSDFDNTEGGGQSDFNPVAPDIAIGFIEVPEEFSQERKMFFLAPRIRAHDQIIGGGVWGSGDDTSYEFSLHEENIHTGGTLQADFDAGVSELAQGPLITVQGPDIANVEDLSTTPNKIKLWRKGKQIAVINGEIFYLQKVTLISGSTYRLDGLIRARWDTVQQDHKANDPVIIFFYDEIEWNESLLLEPREPFFVKVAAYSGGGEITLDAAPKIEIDPTQGKGVIPMRCPNIRVTAPVLCSPSFKTGQDISFAWDYMSALDPGTGAGEQGYGNPTVPGPVDGSFILRITDLAGIVKREIPTSNLAYTYDNADLVSDFSSEPSSFKAKIYAVRGGWESDVTEITITKES